MTVLENELAQLKLDRTNVQKQSPDKFSGRVENAILGNIPEGETFEAAQSWINAHCKQSGVTLPTEMFFKTEYVGVVFAKYTCDADRDKLISSIAALPKKQFAKGARNPNIWSRIDRPIDVRMAETCLFRMKRMLGDWGYSKSCIKVEADPDTERLTMKVAGKEVVQVDVKDLQLQVKWCDGEWETWDALQLSAELAQIKSECQGKLDKAKSYCQFKGKGKGPE